MWPYCLPGAALSSLLGKPLVAVLRSTLKLSGLKPWSLLSSVDILVTNFSMLWFFNLKSINFSTSSRSDLELFSYICMHQNSASGYWIPQAWANIPCNLLTTKNRAKGPRGAWHPFLGKGHLPGGARIGEPLAAQPHQCQSLCTCQPCMHFTKITGKITWVLRGS